MLTEILLFRIVRIYDYFHRFYTEPITFYWLNTEIKNVCIDATPRGILVNYLLYIIS